MEKEPGIGKNPEGDIAIPEFETKKVKAVETEKKFEKSPEKGWWDVVVDAKLEFPEDIQNLIIKRTRKITLSPEEHSALDNARNKWWKERFGVNFWNRDLTPEQEEIKDAKREEKKEKKKLKRKIRSKDTLSREKNDRMSQLRQAINNLDNGEPITEFGDEARRTVYLEEETGRYYLEENGAKKYIGLGDIASDYAWDIKYVPDGEMTEPAYRSIAKRILVNETRRDIEKIYDHELSQTVSGIPIRPELSKLEEKPEQNLGLIAEIILREFLNRLAINNNLDLVVMRANAVEDGLYKYDFKIRVKNKNRGVAIEDGPDLQSRIFKVGIQLKTKTNFQGEEEIFASHFPKGMKNMVDEVIRLKIKIPDLSGIYRKWREGGKPSGGPEQYLSNAIGAKILKEVTKDMIKISDEEIARIFSDKTEPQSPEIDKAA